MEPHIIAKAIKRLFDATGPDWGFTQWADFLGFGTTPEEVKQWTTCTTDIGPTDSQMTAVLRHCEHIQGSESCSDMPAAITNFYNVLHEIEEDPSKGQGFITLKPREAMHHRLTRFTNNQWQDITYTCMLHIHPSRRHEFINGVIALVDKLQSRGARQAGEVTETHVINFSCQLCNSANVQYEMVDRSHERVTCKDCSHIDDRKN